MIFQELHRINQTFILDPFVYTPTDLCPREEIVAPEKLLAVVHSDRREWEPYVTPMGDTLQRIWLPWTPTYSDRVSGVCFYVVARDPELFDSVRTVTSPGPPSGDPDASALLAWLLRWRAHYFLVTTTLLMYHGDTSDIIYSVNHGVATLTTPLVYTAPTLDQMIDHNAYTVGNALTLMLAMERAGYWRSAAVQEALHRFHALGGGHGLGAAVSPIPQPFIVFYSQHTLYHISNYALLYASMGQRPCAPGIRALLLDIDGFNDFPFPYIQYMTPSQSAAYITSPTSASLPYLRAPGQFHNDPMPFYADDAGRLLDTLFGDAIHADDDSEAGDDDDTSDDDADAGSGESDGPHLPMPPPPVAPPAAPAAPPAAPPPREHFYIADISGIVMSIVSQPSAWAWWNRPRVAETFLLRFVLNGFPTKTEAFDYLFRRLFHLYDVNYGQRRGRLRAILRTAIETLDPEGAVFMGWLGKYAFGRQLRSAMLAHHALSATPFGAPRTGLWNPPIPTAFLHDALRFYGKAFPLYTERVIIVRSLYRTVIENAFGADILESSAPRRNSLADDDDDDDEIRHRFRIRLTFYKTLKRFAPDTPEAAFRRFLDARVTERLLYLSRLCQTPENRLTNIVPDLVFEYYKKNRIELVL